MPGPRSRLPGPATTHPPRDRGSSGSAVDRAARLPRRHRRSRVRRHSRMAPRRRTDRPGTDSTTSPPSIQAVVVALQVVVVVLHTSSGRANSSRRREFSWSRRSVCVPRGPRSRRGCPGGQTCGATGPRPLYRRRVSDLHPITRIFSLRPVNEYGRTTAPVAICGNRRGSPTVSLTEWCAADGIMRSRGARPPGRPSGRSHCPSRVEHMASRPPGKEHLCHPRPVSVERQSRSRRQLAGRAGPVVQLYLPVQHRHHPNDSVRANQQSGLSLSIL